MAEAPNRYCQRLRIAVPDLDDVAAQPDASLFQVMVAALLERGGPMRLDEIAARLRRARLPPRLARPDLEGALRKAWRGQPPVVRDTDDRFALGLLHHDWWYVLARMKGDASRAASTPPLFVAPPDDQPLTPEEVEAAFCDRVLSNCSPARRTAAILEAAGGPLSLESINARLSGLSRWHDEIDEERTRSWQTDLVLRDASGMMRLNPASADVPALRRAIRKMALATLRMKAEQDWRAAQRAESPDQAKAARLERERQDMEEARAARRALVHAARDTTGDLLASVVVDADAREMRVFGGEQATALEAALASFDLLAGADLRGSLRALGLDPERWWLAELRPVDRTHRPDRGKSIPVTLDGCLRATTGYRRRLAGPPEWTRLVRTGSGARRLRAQIEEEARALFAFYQYGALHGGVRVRPRADDMLLGVSWSMAGDPDLRGLLEVAERAWSAIDVVVGSPPPLADPWATARRVEVADARWPWLVLRQQGRTAAVAAGAGETRARREPGWPDQTGAVEQITANDIHAARLADPEAASLIRPRSLFRRLDERACRMKVTLDGIEPPIWRRLVVPAHVTLARLHAILQAALGWTNSHLHVFEVGRERIGTPYELADLEESYTRSGRVVELADVLDRGIRRFTYEYDFGDGWEHTVEIEQVDAAEAWTPARCLVGARACPPEDCGGVDGYARLLEIVFDPRHAEFQETREWLGPAFDPERFNLREVNDRLRELDRHPFE